MADTTNFVQYRVRSRAKSAGRLTVQDLILSHAVWVPVTTKADDDQTLLLRHDGLVDVPAGNEMG